ncbi:nucleoporin NUP42-like [Lagopus leucura]|uniref:nucleoporin NUP42-like n=1 Tax=Lagopus leucura TaxID=30410 RepID=UPI001C681383|nr:nucleoporin NUP42-like [Lagopus leucura]
MPGEQHRCFSATLERESGHSTITFSWIGRTVSPKHWVPKLSSQQQQWCCPLVLANPSVSSGSAPAVGSSAAASSPPALGVTSSHSCPHPVGTGDAAAPSAARSSLNAPGTAAGRGLLGFRALRTLLRQILPAPLRLPSLLPRQLQNLLTQVQAVLWPHRLPVPLHTAPRLRLLHPHGIRAGQLHTPRRELMAGELEQFRAKKFTLGKVLLKPPPADLLYDKDLS